MTNSNNEVNNLEDRVAHLEDELARIKEYHAKTLSYQTSDPEASLWMTRKAVEAICRQIFILEISDNPDKNNPKLRQLRNTRPRQGI